MHDSWDLIYSLKRVWFYIVVSNVWNYRQKDIGNIYIEIVKSIKLTHALSVIGDCYEATVK